MSKAKMTESMSGNAAPMQASVPTAPATPDGIPIQEQLPTHIAVHVNSIRTGGPVLARASVTLNGCFAIRGVKIVAGENGPFVSMPSYKQGEEFKDTCFPCTKEFHEQFRASVLEAYQQELAQLSQRSQELPSYGMAMS